MVNWDLVISEVPLKDYVEETGITHDKNGEYVELMEHLTDNKDHWYTYAVRLGDPLTDDGKKAPLYKLWFDKDDNLVSINLHGQIDVND